MGERLLQPSRVERVRLQPLNCVSHRAIIGCVNQLSIVVTSAAAITDSQTDLLKCLSVDGCMLVGEVVRRKVEGVCPEGVNAGVEGPGCGSRDIGGSSPQEVVESGIGTKSEEFDPLVVMRKGFQKREISFKFGTNLVKKVVSELRSANWRTQHLDAKGCTRKSEARRRDKRGERALSWIWARNKDVGFSLVELEIGGAE